MGFAFVHRKNLKFLISIPHSTLKQKIPMKAEEQATEEEEEEEDEEEDREEEGNRAKRRKA